MEKDKIKHLLEKYWDAATTVEEEKLLKQYFANSTADEELAKAWFGSINDFKVVDTEAILGDMEPIAKLPERYFFLKIAATLVLVGIMALLSISHNSKLEEEKEFAMRQKAEASLQAIAQDLNQGYQSLNQTAEMMVKEQFSKQ